MVVNSLITSAFERQLKVIYTEVARPHPHNHILPQHFSPDGRVTRYIVKLYFIVFENHDISAALVVFSHVRFIKYCTVIGSPCIYAGIKIVFLFANLLHYLLRAC